MICVEEVSQRGKRDHHGGRGVPRYEEKWKGKEEKKKKYLR